MTNKPIIRASSQMVPRKLQNRFVRRRANREYDYRGQDRIPMKDLKAELEKLLANAEDCELIARLATDKTKRETFTRIATQLREMAAELQADIAAHSQGGRVAPDSA